MQYRHYIFGHFCLDPAQGLLLKDGERIPLPPKPFQALELLVEGRGAIVSKTVLLETIWPDSFVEDSSLTQCIFLLRKALGKTDEGIEIVETVPRRGYRIGIPVDLIEPVSETPAPSAESVRTIELPSAAEAPPDVPDTRNRLPWWAVTAAGIAVVASTLFVLSRNGLIWQKPEILRFTRLTNDGAYKERLISLLTDGSRIYFSEDVDAQSYLAEVSTEGGETSRKPAPHPIDTALAYSRSTNEILFGSLWEQSSEHAFTAMSLSGGSLRSVGELSGHAASWSPDGLHIAYIKGNKLILADSDGSHSKPVARMDEPPSWPRWSPDGARIRFSTQHWTQDVGLWEINADGSSLHPLFAKEPWARIACCGDWTPDGRYYVFVVNEARRSSLWIARDRRNFWQSGKPGLLAEGPADFWRAPIFSQDGKQIFALGEQARGELMRYDAASRQFLPYLGGLSTDTLSFSRDGQWMAWTAYPEGTLWRSRIDGTERIRLTDPGSIARFPEWSPDGKQLTYISPGKDNLWKIYQVPSGGGTHELLASDKMNQGVPTWSADGSKLVFGQVVTFGVRQQSFQLRILDLKTHALSPLTGSEGLWKARWSPDGNFISAVTADNHKLKLYDVQSSRWMELADVGVNDCVWSHDGESIYFDSPWEPTIFRYHLKTHTLERYASLKGIRRTGFFGWSLNLAPDDSPVLLREAGIHEVYALQAELP